MAHNERICKLTVIGLKLGQKTLVGEFRTEWSELLDQKHRIFLKLVYLLL